MFRAYKYRIYPNDFQKELIDKHIGCSRFVYNLALETRNMAYIGSIGGLIYAKRTGGGFWRYVGYWVVGGLVTGIPSRLVATPFKNKILKEADVNNKTES